MTSEDSTCGHNQEGDNPPRGLEEKACCPSAEEDKMEKSLDDLKVERTTAKRLFSRLANSITRTHTEMSIEELRENLKKLTLESSRVLEANKEVEVAYMTESDVATAEELGDLLKADLEKTEKNCSRAED